MANKLLNAWRNNRREVDGWRIDSRCDSLSEAEIAAAQLLPTVAAKTKIEREGNYFYILFLPTTDERALLAELDD